MPGCTYWFVEVNDPQAVWFRAFGLARFYWSDEARIDSSPTVRVIRMPSTESILSSIESMGRIGTDLVADGGFEKEDLGSLYHWVKYGEPQWMTAPEQAEEGKNYVTIPQTAAWYQTVPIPGGVKEVELSFFIKKADKDLPAAALPTIQWIGEQGNEIQLPSAPFKAGDRWAECHFSWPVPAGIDSARLSLEVKNSSGPCCFDNVHLFVTK
jgi:hypothetical protein